LGIGGCGSGDVRSKLGWLEAAIRRRMLKNLEGKTLSREIIAEAALEAHKAYAGDEIRVEIDPGDKNKISISIDDVHRIWE
jgi:hypothetical protein